MLPLFSRSFFLSAPALFFGFALVSAKKPGLPPLNISTRSFASLSLPFPIYLQYLSLFLNQITRRPDKLVLKYFLLKCKSSINSICKYFEKVLTNFHLVNIHKMYSVAKIHKSICNVCFIMYNIIVLPQCIRVQVIHLLYISMATPTAIQLQVPLSHWLIVICSASLSPILLMSC